SHYRLMLQRIAGPASAEEFAALRTLTDVLEPVKDYTRWETMASRPITTTPLNRIVDAIQPESDAARRFDGVLNEFVSGGCGDAELASRLRAQFVSWQANDAVLRALAQRSSYVQEVTPLSQDLAAVGKVGAEALDAIQQRTTTGDDMKARW